MTSVDSTETNEDCTEYEKPLSPVLNQTKGSRKILIGRRIHNKKARVKLLNHFDKIGGPSSENVSQTDTHPVLNSLTESQTHKLLEGEDQTINQEPHTSSNSKKNSVLNVAVNSCFKKPISPAPHAKKIVEHHSRNVTVHQPSGNICFDRDKEFPSADNIGFQTASGKGIKICDSVLKVQQKLFEDILTPGTVNGGEIRSNKYSFLSKTGSKIEINKPYKPSAAEEYCSKTKSFEVDSHDENIDSFTQQITDSGITNTQIDTFCDEVLSRTFDATTPSTLKAKSAIIAGTVDTSREKQLFEDTKSALKVAHSLCKTVERNLTDGEDSSQNVSNNGFKGFSHMCIESSEIISAKLNKMLGNISYTSQRDVAVNTQKFSSERTIFSVHDKISMPTSCTNSVKIEVIRSPPSKKTKIHNFSESETTSCLGTSSLYSSRTSCGDGMRKNKYSVIGNVNRNDYVQTGKMKDLSEYSGTTNDLTYSRDISEQTLKGGGELYTSKYNKISSVDEKIKNMLDLYTRNKQNVPNKCLTDKTPSTDTSRVEVYSGFQTASGNKMKIKENLLVDAKKLFDSCNSNEAEELIPLQNHDLDTKVDNFNSAEANVNVYNNPVKNPLPSCGFQTASGAAIHVSEKMLRNAQKLLESCSADVPNFDLKGTTKNPNTSTLHCHSPYKITELGPSVSLPKDKTDILQNRNIVLETVTRDNINESKSCFNRAKRLFDGDAMSLKPDFTPLSSESTKNQVANLGISPISMQSPDNKVSTEQESMECDTVGNLDWSGNTSRFCNTATSVKPKRRLGVSSCKQISLSEVQLNKAKSIFNEDVGSVMPVWKSSPVSKLTKTLALQSTPIKRNVSHNISSFVNSTVTSGNPNIETFIDSTITPIKGNNSNIATLVSEVEEDYHMFTDSPILIQKPTAGNIDKWMEDLEHERCLLQKKLEILTHRSLALRQQKKHLCHITVENIRKQLGALSQAKLTRPRIKWLDFVKDQKPGDVKAGENLNRLTEITPQNAENVHFNCLTRGIEDVITTADGAILVPNVKNLIGLAEVESAFKVMPGVEAKYIPDGWVKNHYKWIIWKLASYERSFPVQCEGSFTLENVMQQLKYRYDREIDKVERPALRKIYEKDDVPQKRMILCVCDIVKICDSKYELVLTDGWYSIRTTIDDALCQQIDCGKIQIGTKLITHCAELLNCEGCYPLEASDMVRLKICFNCTRRVKWYTKLGYYRISTPFPIPIETISPLGGLVAYVKVYIARVYPVRYMERTDNVTVWRNAKAEERRAQEWENERLKKIDELQEQAYEECDTDYSPKETNYSHQSTINLKNITCPQTLYNIVMSSKDPEYIQGELSESQKKCILKYQESIASSRQQRLSSKISENLQKVKQLKRDVLPILKMVVVDIYKPSTRGVSLYIWNPTENHMQILKEGRCFGIYNVIPKRNGDLSTNTKTKFEQLPSGQHIPDNFTRMVTPIASLIKSERTFFLSEFDTIGVVVQTKLQTTSQDLWLTDFEERLLHIKISEGPATCLLLDNIKRGQIICCSNLVMCQGNCAFAQAIANHFTILTSHPQQKHLQEALNQFKRDSAKDVNNILTACDIKIEEENPTNTFNRNTVLEDSTEDSTLVYTRITSTDIAMSLIDIDQYK